jgi:hypothetical protein
MRQWWLCLIVLAACTAPQVCSDDRCFNVEIADEPDELQEGLMHTTIDDDEGMLFVFEEPGRYSFWMKNTTMALDIVWLDRDGTVIDIVRGAPPCDTDCKSYTPRRAASYVLETAGGRSGLVVGENVSIPYNSVG